MRLKCRKKYQLLVVENKKCQLLSSLDFYSLYSKCTHYVFCVDAKRLRKLTIDFLIASRGNSSHYHQKRCLQLRDILRLWVQMVRFVQHPAPNMVIKWL